MKLDPKVSNLPTAHLPPGVETATDLLIGVAQAEKDLNQSDKLVAKVAAKIIKPVRTGLAGAVFGMMWGAQAGRHTVTRVIAMTAGSIIGAGVGVFGSDDPKTK